MTSFSIFRHEKKVQEKFKVLNTFENIMENIWSIKFSIFHDTFKYIVSKASKGTTSVRVYAVIISKYATKIVGTQKRQVACVHGTQDQKQLTFNTFKPAQ